jgi:tetratricopeptide (TPR) repeat protein
MRPSTTTSARLTTALTTGLAAALLAAGCSGKSQQTWNPPTDLIAAANADLQRAQSLAAQAQQAENDDRPDDAIDLYRQSVAAYREFPAAWNNLGRLLMEKGDGLEAATALRVAADLSPSDPRPVYNLGWLWEERGYMEEASRYYAQALDRNENYLDALRGSIYVDRHHRNYADEMVARRIRRALLIETDPRWRDFFEREKIRIDEDPRASAGPMSR